MLLGGQPASGKTNLIAKIKKYRPDRQFVVINGDEFRVYHPRYEEIYHRYASDAPHYTQRFSNQMVEWAKQACITGRYNFIIEGTMRTFGVIEQTVSMLKAADYQAELHVLAIPRIESLLGIFDCYERDMTLTGQERFSAIAVHDEAYHNIPANLQRAARELPVDRVVIYSRDLTNKTVVCLATAETNSPATVDFEATFAQIRQPQRGSAFYRTEYERLRQSAQQRSETNAVYLAQLTTLGTELS